MIGSLSIGGQLYVAAPMATFTALYTKPENDAEAFLEEYKNDHVPIADRFLGMTSSSVTVFSGTPRGTDPGFYVMFHGVWDSMDDLNAALADPAMAEAGMHARGLVQKYGNAAQMLIGDDA